LTEVGRQIKALCENTPEVAHVYRLTEEYKKVIEVKRKELDTCDFDCLLIGKIAQLFNQDRIVTFQQAILNSQLIDSIYPPEVHPNLNFTGRLDTRLLPEKKAHITDCTILRDGIVALVHSLNSSIKLFAANGVFKGYVKVDSRPFDITESDQGFCVSHSDK
jgi:hypothetical protein